MTLTLSVHSERHLIGVHPDLVRVVRKMQEIAISPVAIICGLRTLDEQEHLLASGASNTIRSRHLTGHAVDWVPIVGGEGSWTVKDYLPLIAQWKEAGAHVGVPIESGGDWLTLKDYDHLQLPWAIYPAFSATKLADFLPITVSDQTPRVPIHWQNS